jgi:hypothetical protein
MPNLARSPIRLPRRRPPGLGISSQRFNDLTG